MEQGSEHHAGAILVLLFAACVSLRGLLFGAVSFINPDSAVFLKPDFLVVSQRLPFFPVLVNTLSLLGVDRFLAGKIVNAVCGSAAVFPLYTIVRQAGGSRRAGLFSGLLYALSPLPFSNQVLALSEGTFVLFMLVAIDGFFRLVNTGRWVSFFELLIGSGLAALTRAEGYALVPIALLGGYV